MVGMGTALRGVSLLLATTVMVTANYIKDKCYCYPEFDATIKEKISKFRNLDDPTQYSYYGAKYSGSGTTFADCDCHDVTRVAVTLNVTDSDYITLASNADNAAQLRVNVTRQLNAAATQYLNTRPALQDRLLDKQTFVALNRQTSDSYGAIFNVELIFRGNDATINTEVEAGLKTDAMGDGTLEGVGTVDTSAMVFTVLQCTDNALPAMDNGNVTSNTNLAGEKVIYLCGEGYRLSSKTERHVSTCNHTTLVWDKKPTGITCIEDKRCHSNPPKFDNIVDDWENSHEENTVITYTCATSYRNSAMNETTSKCTNKAWTAVDANFIRARCIFVGCLEAPPQTVDHGVVNWDKTLYEGTQASYSCKPGYKSTVNPDPRLQCMNQTWGKLPEGYVCVNTNIDDDEFDDIHYFFIVTIPSVAGLTLAILVCLCCTRMDSPIFRACNRRQKSQGYDGLA